jgi:hypothetical protein
MNQMLVAAILLHQHLGESTLALQEQREASHHHTTKIADT